MRKEEKRNLAAAIVTVMVLLAVYILLGKMQEKLKAGALEIYSYEASQVTCLEYQSVDGPISLVRTENGWVWVEDESFPLNQNFMETMATKTSTLTARRFVGEGRDQFLASGLDSPTNIITVTIGDQVRVILLGNTNSATGDCYMGLEGSDRVYTVDSTFPTLFSNSLTAMASRESLPGITIDKISRFAVSMGDESRIEFYRSSDKPDGDSGWMIRATETDGETEFFSEADGALVTELLGQVIKLRYEEMAVYQPSEEQLEAYGLREPEARLEIVYWRDDGEKENYVIRAGGLGLNDADSDGEMCYLYAEGSRGIYGARKSSLEPFLRLTPEAFLSLSVAAVKVEDLERLVIASESGTVEWDLFRSGDGKIQSFERNGQEITEAEFNSFYYQLYALDAEKRVSDLADQLTREPVLKLTYGRIAGKGGDIEVELIPYDQNYYGAKVNGKAFLLVNRQRVNSLLNKIAEFL